MVYKIVKSKQFKKQENKLTKKEKTKLEKVLTSIAKNPINQPCSMEMFSKPSPEELKQWMGKIKVQTTDLILEYLVDKNCLNKQGKVLAKDFWIKYIKRK
jgi:hypothetical protein